MLTDKQKLWESCVVPSFSDLMIKQLAQHSERGVSWRNADPDSLLRRAKEELKELEDALDKLDTDIDMEKYIKQLKCIAKECADVANFMMMIVDSVDTISPR